MTAITESAPRGRTITIVLWVLQVLAAAAFIAAGTFKLIAAPQMVEIFQHIGIGQWFRVVTGIVEIVGGLAMLIPAAAAFGGLLLATTMVFATLTHLFVIGGNPLPAIVLFAVTASVAWLRRDRISAALRR